MSVPGVTPPSPEQMPNPPAGEPAAAYPPPQYGTPQYGAPQYAQPQYGVPQYAPQPPYVQYASRRNLLAATLLCFFVGVFGVHRFYVGKVGTGVAQLLTFGGFGIWTLIDFIMLVCQAFKDIDGYTLRWDTVH